MCNRTPPLTGGPRRLTNGIRVVTIEVLQQRRVSEEGPGNPTAVLRTVPGPVNEVLETSTFSADIQYLVDAPSLVTS